MQKEMKYEYFLRLIMNAQFVCISTVLGRCAAGLNGIVGEYYI